MPVHFSAVTRITDMTISRSYALDGRPQLTSISGLKPLWCNVLLFQMRPRLAHRE